MDGIYYVIKRKVDGKHVGPRGVSTAPHLYNTKGIAELRRGSIGRGLWKNPDHYEVVPVRLTEIKEGQ